MIIAKIYSVVKQNFIHAQKPRKPENSRINKNVRELLFYQTSQYRAKLPKMRKGY